MRFILGLFFILSAVAKLVSIENFELYVFSMGWAGFDVCAIAARLVIIGELCLGINFMADIWNKATKAVTWLSLLGFSAFLISRIAVGDQESCHCMGDLVDMDPWQSLVKNVVLALCVAVVGRFHLPVREPGLQGWLRRRNLPVLLAAVICTTALTFVVRPPDVFFRQGKSPHDFVPEKFQSVRDSLKLSDGREMVCFFSTECQFCQKCMEKVSGIMKRHELPGNSVHAVFMQTVEEGQEELVRQFFRDHGRGVELPFTCIHPLLFIPVTNGSMPLVVLLKDGELVEEFDYVTLSEPEIVRFLQGND